MFAQAQAGTTNGSSASGDGKYDFDLFTIGAGSGGVRASRFAASNYGNSSVPSCFSVCAMLPSYHSSVP